MFLRRYRQEDCLSVIRLFHDTVHAVNSRDYSPEQIAVWAPSSVDEKKWNTSLLSHCSFLCFEEDELLGFGDIDETGYLDRLYVSKDHQGRGIATLLCDTLESCGTFDRIITHASITARPFFEGRGYVVLKEQMVERSGVLLTNFIMEKVLVKV